MSEQLIFQLMPKVMAEVTAIEKNRKNQDQKYSFRGIDDVYAALHGPLSRHGVFYVPEVLEREVSERQSRSGGTLFQTRLLVAYTFFASDGSSIRAVVAGEGMDSSDKSTNKAMSAALKYALLQIFCVPVEDQDDADAETPEPIAQQRPKPPAPPKVVKPVKPESEPTAPAMALADEAPDNPQAELRWLAYKLGYDDDKLRKWLIKKYHVNANLNIGAALLSLGEGELQEAIGIFDRHIEAASKEAA